MAHEKSLEALHRTLQDLRGNSSIKGEVQLLHTLWRLLSNSASNSQSDSRRRNQCVFKVFNFLAQRSNYPFAAEYARLHPRTGCRNIREESPSYCFWELRRLHFRRLYYGGRWCRQLSRRVFELIKPSTSSASQSRVSHHVTTWFTASEVLQWYKAVRKNALWSLIAGCHSDRDRQKGDGVHLTHTLDPLRSAI